MIITHPKWTKNFLNALKDLLTFGLTESIDYFDNNIKLYSLIQDYSPEILQT